jgi:ligand-binding sensor domain-containing protein
MPCKFIFSQILIFILFATRSSILFAQEKNIRFSHLCYKDGLIQSPIVTMHHDSSGYIWVGSWSNLSRYDGVTFKNFRQVDTIGTAISHNRINKVFEDKNGNLWIGTSRGLNLYDEKTEQFHHVGILPGEGGENYVATIEADHYGKLWVSTFKGLKMVSDSHDQLETISLWKETGENDLFEGISFSLFADNAKTMWVGIRQGLKRFDVRTKKVLPLPDVIAKSIDLSLAKIVVIKQDPTGDLWLGTEEHGLFRYSEKNNFCIRYLCKENDANSIPSNWINDILIKDGKVWIATRSGLSIFDPVTNTFSNYRHDSANAKSLNDDSVWSLMEDKNGNIWIGTYAGGINLYYPGNSNFTNIGEQIGNNVGLNKPLANAILEDNDGALWMGTFNGGLHYINRNKDVAKRYSVRDVNHGKLSNEIKCMKNGSYGKLWIGTLDGLCIFDVKTGDIKYVDIKIFDAKTTTTPINALAIDKDGVWVGSNGGGLRFVTFDGKESKMFVFPYHQNTISNNYVNALLKDENYLWIATQNGLNRYDPLTNEFKIFRRNKKFGLSNNNVSTLFEDSNGRLWIGTDDGGLNCLDKKTDKIYVINRANGLVDDVVNCIIEDNHGVLWVSTNYGLSRITFSKKQFPIQPTDYGIINYTSANGLSGNQFLVNAGTKLSNGEILFGGMNGVTAFFPEKIVKNNNVPEILFTGFSIRGKEVSFGDDSPLRFPINETSEITLPYVDNNITIKFSALNFINPEKNVYAYQMLGLPDNDEWIEIGNQKEVSFVNLKPGDYTFKIKAANNDNVWNEKGRTLVITILPPMWQTRWAYLLYAVITFLILYKIIQFFRTREAT